MAPLDRPLVNNSAQSSAAPEVVLRRACREDIPAIDAMHALSVQALGAADYTAAEIEAILGHFGTYDPTLIDDGTYFVLVHDGRVVGSGGWSRRLPHGGVPQDAEGGGAGKAAPFTLSPSSAKIRAIFVHPDYARLGLGSRLVRNAETEAAAAGHHLLELWATLTGGPLYRRLGYQDLGRLSIPCANGAVVTMVHMAKLVPAVSATAA